MVLARVLLILLPRLQTLTLSTYSTTSRPAAKVNLFVYCSRRVAIYRHPANPLLRPFREYLHVYEIGTQHKSMVVESQIRVLNLPLTISNEGDAGGMEFFDSPEIRDRCWEYLQESRWISSQPDIWKQAIDVTHSENAVFGKAAAIMRWINSEFAYEPRVTDAKKSSRASFHP